MKPPALLCVATDGFAEVWDFCIASQRAYAARLGREHVLLTEPAPGLNGKWTKLARARDMLAEGRDLLVLDADAEIAPGAPDFAAAMAPADKAVFAALGVSGRPNSGVMMLRAGAGAVSFLEACLEARERPVEKADFVTREGENGHVIRFLRDPRFASLFGELPAIWNCTRPECADGAHVRHYTNLLRKDLDAGRRGPGIAIPPADAADARLRAAARLHAAARPKLVERLEAAPAFLDELRRLTEAGRGGLEFPRLAVDDANAWLWRHEFASGLREAPTIALLRRLARPGGAFLDGGAHVGYFSRALLDATGGRQRVIAVEAHPRNMAVCARNLAGAGAVLVEAALTDRDGPLELFDGSGHSNSSVNRGGPASGEVLRVAGRSLDSILAELGDPPIDLAKIDIEGAELSALAGAKRLFARCPRMVLAIESNPKLLRLAGARPADLVGALGALGWRGRMIRDDFSLGPVGYVSPAATVNMAFAREERWAEIEATLRLPAG